MLPIIQKSCMIFDIDVADREEAIRLMADCLYKNGYLLDKDQFCQDVYDREKFILPASGMGSVSHTEKVNRSNILEFASCG